MALQTISLTEGKHYWLSFYEGHGWEWEGINVFSKYCCTCSYSSRDAAINDAEQSLLKLLS